tara:strand:- start:12404 stop:15844 length:3441 start_codon:yes stop_codon:yes gene_type:complete
MNESEIREEENLLLNKDYDYLYPNLNDPNFIIKIAEKKEFNDTEYNGEIYDVETQGDKLCNAQFELANHQIFVRNFLSNQTPYNGLLLYHGLGTGKTCSAITISEEYREYMKQMGITKRIIIVGNKNIQDNYRLQLFDERKLELIDGKWNLVGCTSNKFINEINPMNMKGITKTKIISQVNTIINTFYLFIGYREFGNMIGKKINKFKNEPDIKLKEKNIETTLRNEFSNRLVIIDEVQNIRLSDNIEDKKVGQRLLEVTKYTDNLKLILLSATPMFNSYKEIVWLINLLNQNDKRSTISLSDIFDKTGNFKIDINGKNIGQEILRKKIRGYVSFVRGDNPYTFPYRIYPSVFAPDNSIKNIEYPKKQINGKTLLQKIEHVDVFAVNIGYYQKIVYDKISEEIKSKYVSISENNLDKGLGYQVLETPLQILNITYPTEDIEEIKNTYGKIGLDNVMKRKPLYTDFEYSYYERIFNIENIGKYSPKIKNICNSILTCKGIVIIYSQYLDGGIVPMALALEELGFSRFGRDNLFKTPPSEPIDSITMLPKSKVEKSAFKQAKYSIITGDLSLSPNNIKEIKKITDSDNINGENVKVVLISRAGSEGIDFKNVRQIHIIDPWYNMNRIEQIIGRGVRTCSHKSLPFNKRNVMIFLYATYIDNEYESLDLYLYRLAEIKAMKIGKVSRILKQNSIDCILNKGQTNFTIENMNQVVKQVLSNDIEIDWNVGDKPFTALCDYLDSCSYECLPDKDILDINYDTYNEDFISLNIEKIIEKIKNIFKDQYICDKEKLIRTINYVKEYPLVQIYSALDKLLNNENELLTDMFGKKGFLVNIGNYYLFQPIEIKDETISIYERTMPIKFKHQKIKVNLPKNINNVLDSLENKETIESDVLEETKDKSLPINKLLKDLQDKFILATTPNDFGRGSKNWYELCYKTIERMMDDGIEKYILEYLIIEHIMETLLINNIIILLNYLSNKKEYTDFEKFINKYFQNKILQNESVKGIVLNDNGKLVILIFKDNEWIKATPLDIRDLGDLITNQIEIPQERLANIVGFIIEFKNEQYVYKTLDLEQNKSGARCDQSGKSGVIKVLNKAFGEEKYNKDNTSGINVTQLCSEQELYLRYFNYIKKNDNYWFLTPEQIIRTKILK